MSPSGLRSYGATTGWVQGHHFYLNDETTALGASAGAYGTLSSLTYFFYGGDYTDPSVVILPNKNVGIGTVSPIYKLDVAGTGRFTNNVKIEGGLNITGTSGYSEGIRIKGVNGISSIWFNAINDSQYDPKMYGLTVDSSGLRFRYGTGSTPSDIASISNTGNIKAVNGNFSGIVTAPLYQSGAYNWTTKTGGFHSGVDGYLEGGLSWYNGSGTSASIYRLNNNLVLGRGSNQSLTIDTSSNVSIIGNTTTNRITLSSVAAEAHLEFSRPSYNYITAPLGGGINFVTNGDSTSALNSMLVLSPNGNVGIGKGFTNNTTSITAQLHVRGNILSTGEVTAYVASDRRLKENIKPITSALDYINRLNPVTYNWNAKAKELNANKPNGLDYGLIAQEVESVLPNIVHGIFDDKYKSIDYTKLIPIMIGAIKELKQEINKLKK
jgi:hypothetical protein